MSKQAAPSTSDIWAVISKEITGIQLLWTAVEQLYFKGASDRGIASLEQETPVLYRLMQTALMESLLMRMSRLMDPSASGRGAGAQPNLSLARLMDVDTSLASEIGRVRLAWDASGLRSIRDKYMSHNDLARATTQEHTLNIPSSSLDIDAMRALAQGLREFRRGVHQMVNGVAYLDEAVSTQLEREADVLNRSLVAGGCFYQLLPDHACLQEALAEVESKQEPNAL